MGKEIAQLGHFSLLPAWTRIAYGTPGSSDNPPGTWIVDFGRGVTSRLIPRNAPTLKWSPDGKFIY